MECEEDNLLEAAKALLLLSSTPPPDRSPASMTPVSIRYLHPPAAVPGKSIENAFSVFLPPWGFRSKRSRYTGKAKGEQVEGPSSSVAAASPYGHRSPDTPFCLGATSYPSTSGSDEFQSSSEIPLTKRFRAGKTSATRCDARVKVAEAERVRPSQPIGRQGRRKTLSELRAEELGLVEEKKRLMMLLESKRIERDGLVAENQRLSSELASKRARAEEELPKHKVLLPDLNEPVLELLEPDCADN